MTLHSQTLTPNAHFNSDTIYDSTIGAPQNPVALDPVAAAAAVVVAAPAVAIGVVLAAAARDGDQHSQIRKRNSPDLLAILLMMTAAADHPTAVVYTVCISGRAP